jgi:hypothetical protein
MRRMNSINTCLSFVLGSVSIFALSELHVLMKNFLDKKAATNTIYIDIKSECLRDVLRMVLKGVHGISAKEDKPSASSASLTM